MRIERLIQLKPEEDILEIVHEDLVPHAVKFGLLFFWFVIPFFFLFPLFRLGWIGVLVFFALLISAVLMLARGFMKWAYTVLVVTDQRVIDHEQRGLFDRVVTETTYGNIDEVSCHIKGFFPTLFRYGDISVKLSGSAADIAFRRVKRPVRLHDLLNDLCAQSRNEVRDEREKKLRSIAKNLSPDQLNALIGQVRKRERDEAVEHVFGKD